MIDRIIEFSANGRRRRFRGGRPPRGGEAARAPRRLLHPLERPVPATIFLIFLLLYLNIWLVVKTNWWCWPAVLHGSILVPVGTGADVMKRIAAPMIGGIFTSFLLELVVYPAVYEVWKWNFELRKNEARPAAVEAPVYP
jgi:hypothetical protein